MRHISESTIRRLSLYLRALESQNGRSGSTISSEELAHLGGTSSAQVRKDLSLFGSFGTRGLGYPIPELIVRLREILGLQRQWRVVIVGAGKIGSALAQYHGFHQRGFEVVGVYDRDRSRVGKRLDSLTVRNVEQLAADARRLKPDIAVLAVPAEVAQGVCDRLVQAGFHAILNFAPVRLRTPDGVVVRTVNMALELESLAFVLAGRER
jgi:redox-sensing transcriptional repressor